MKLGKFVQPEFNMLEMAAIVTALENYRDKLSSLQQDSMVPDAKLRGELMSAETALQKASQSLKNVSPKIPL
mgnify:CR=1 FL=1